MPAHFKIRNKRYPFTRRYAGAKYLSLIHIFMPGKINPVIPEVVSQVAFNIIGNDFTITMAAEAGQLELNAFEPVVFYNLFESIETLGRAAGTLNDNCIEGITANPKHCAELVDASVGISTALCPAIGYAAAASIAKESLKTGTPVKELVLKKGLLSEREVEVLLLSLIHI